MDLLIGHFTNLWKETRENVLRLGILSLITNNIQMGERRG